MSFIRKIFGGGSSANESGGDDSNALWLYVRCNRCGAPVAVRVDTRNDISVDYETGGKYLRKEIMDSTCFQLMYAEVHFGSGGAITEQKIEKGTFLSKEEYDAQLAEFRAKHGKA